MSYNLAVLGATGHVGQKMIEILEEKKLPIDEIYFFASKRSAGNKIKFLNKDYEIIELTEENLGKFKIDFALSALDAKLSKEFSPVVAKNGGVVIDNSSAYRNEEGYPLVVPEINPEEAFKNTGIIASPNCSTIQSVVALEPLCKKYGIERIIYTTYQAVSGSGKNGTEDLNRGIKGEDPKFYLYPIAFNILPHIDDFLDTGYTKEEMKMVNETRKIFGDNDLKITATAVRVPVYNSHCVAINVELKKPFEIEDIFEMYRNFPGIVLMDDVKNNVYPMPIDADGKDEVYVGRIRRDDSVENGLNLWCVADNVRKGAALNTIQILELIAK